MIDETLVIHNWPADHPGQKAFYSRIEVGNEVAAELTAGVSQPLRIETRHRHEQQPDALYTGASNGDASSVDFSLGAGHSMKIANAGGAVFFGDDNLAHNGVGE